MSSVTVDEYIYDYVHDSCVVCTFIALYANEDSVVQRGSIIIDSKAPSFSYKVS